MEEAEPERPPTLPYGESAGAIYSEVVRDELANERNRKASFEQRGITVVTTSGVLVSLLFAFAAVGSRNGPLPTDAATPLLIALGAFSLAAILGLATNIPQTYEELDFAALERLVDERWWKVSPSDGARRVAEARLRVLKSARKQTTGKGNLLTVAIGLEVLAVAALSVAVRSILVS